MALQPMPAICDRARTWVSLRLDGELSELEDALLASHLRRCASCAEYADAVGGTVAALRAQPLERLEHPITVAPRHRGRIGSAVAIRVAALAAVVVGVTSLLGTQPSKRPVTPKLPAAAAAAVGDDTFEELRTLRRIQLGGRPPGRSGIGQFGAVLSQRR
jgi:predicted anti-sigma-YlaC factor YlaD